MTLPLKLPVRKGTSDAEAPEPLLAAASPSQGFYLPHSSVCFSLFIFHVLSWHERDLFPSRWKGRFRLALRSHGAQQDEAGVEGWRGGGSFSGFKASKQLAQTEKVFPQRTCCSVLCSYPKHVPLHKCDQWTPSGNPDKKNYDF